MRKVINLISKYRNYRKVKKYQKLQRKVNKLKPRAKAAMNDAIYVKKINRYIKARVSRIVLKALYVYPVKKNRVMFMSYEAGQYTCNPRKITEYLLDNYPGEFEIVWAFKEPYRFSELTEKGIHLVQYNSFEYIKMALTSKFFVYNMRIPEAIPFRKSQTTISTGHGGGAYKKLLLDTPGITKKDKNMIMLSTSNTDIYVSTNKRYTECVVRGAYGHKGEVLECGMPRNDDLVNNHLEDGKEVREYYNLDDDVNIILYAPTYRKGTRKAADYDFDPMKIKEAAEERFGGKWIVMYRLHHFIKTPLSYEACKQGIIDATKYYDMQKLIMASSILITDYSSSVWDFSLMYKPCFLYATDIDTYTQVQGFYTDVFEWPFPIGRDNDELAEQIRHFDEAKYKQDVKAHHDQLKICESGHATEIIGKRIYKDCFTK